MDPGMYLYELQDQLHQALGVIVSVSTICRTMKFMGCTRQVIRHIAIQRSDAMRAKFMSEISIHDPSMFVGLMKAAVTEGIAQGNLATALEVYHQSTTGC